MIDSATPTIGPSGRESVVGRGMRALSQYSHWALVCLVVGAVALMVLPVPPVVLDLLIAFNIALSVLLMMLAIYVPGALGLSTFPSLIVLTTVLRLSLNIATTKQILLHAHAGNIIETFGRLVMGGSVVVGLVVFAVIAVVQFIVISKGAERVAEVGARFTLDALPGKQMAIDADLRGGFIDRHEARRQRQLLAQESQMHGSMDGAMKFVKGDAIAAILIALVNIIGGIVIGTSKGMAIADAMARYTLLSIGDGMVSQIPSLLTSIAAGILITRVATQEGRPRNLASQIGLEVITQPRALLASSAVMWGFFLVPGFPKVPFVILGVAFAFLGWHALTAQRVVPRFDQGALVPRDAPAHASAPVRPGEHAIVVPLLLCLAGNLRDRLSASALQAALEREISKLHQELGLSFPDLQVRFDASLSDDSYVVQVQEIPASRGQLYAGNEEGAGAASRDAESELARNVAAVVRLRPDAFVGTQEINALVKRAQDQLPDLHEEVMRSMPMQRVADVLRRLALEGVSLRYLREIYESLITWAAREKDTALLAEHVRVDLGRFICHRFLDENRCLRVITLDSATESQVRTAVQQGANGAYLALPPDVLRDLVASVVAGVAAISADHSPILLATMETRRFLRRVLAQRLPHLSILSYPELPADVQIVQLGRISLPKAAPLRVAAAD